MTALLNIQIMDLKCRMSNTWLLARLDFPEKEREGRDDTVVESRALVIQRVKGLLNTISSLHLPPFAILPQLPREPVGIENICDFQNASWLGEDQYQEIHAE
jgi:hypothetical protein